MRRKRLKFPNGFGSVVFLGKNRRNPYGAVVTTEWTTDGRQVRKYVGYGESYDEAYKKLCDYHQMPYNLDFKSIRICDIYEVLESRWKQEYLENKMSYSNYRYLVSVYNNHMKPIHKSKVLDLKKKDYQKLVDDCDLGKTLKGYIKNVVRRILIYCKDELELIVDINNSNLYIPQGQKSTKHKVVPDKDIKIITKNEELFIVELILVDLYTGYRPSEILLKETTQVFLQENYMIGGIKTETGKNRIIPIHPKIKPIIEKYYNPDNKYLFQNKNGNHYSYCWYLKEFKNHMKKLELDYTPYDIRHTFATKCDYLGIPDKIIKRLMGHSLADDVTNDVYIHKTVEELLKEIEKLHY